MQNDDVEYAELRTIRCPVCGDGHSTFNKAMSCAKSFVDRVWEGGKRDLFGWIGELSDLKSYTEEIAKVLDSKK